MNQIKSDCEDFPFNPFNKSDSLFEDPNENEFNTFLNGLTRHEILSLLHLNIRSLRSSLDDFHNLLEERKHSFNAISLTETWPLV